jgi:hypothetical protein
MSGSKQDWGECSICGECSHIGHLWWCPRNPEKTRCELEKWKRGGSSGEEHRPLRVNFQVSRLEHAGYTADRTGR